MTYDEAIEIAYLYERYRDTCCTCHMGHPPCSRCTECPNEDEYQEALSLIESNF